MIGKNSFIVCCTKGHRFTRVQPGFPSGIITHKFFTVIINLKFGNPREDLSFSLDKEFSHKRPFQVSQTFIYKYKRWPGTLCPCLLLWFESRISTWTSIICRSISHRRTQSTPTLDGQPPLTFVVILGAQMGSEFVLGTSVCWTWTGACNSRSADLTRASNNFCTPAFSNSTTLWTSQLKAVFSLNLIYLIEFVLS